MIYNPFSIITVPFPFTDIPYHKLRPALVISNETFQASTQHITLMMITSAKRSHWINDHPIIELETTGLSTPSLIRQKIFTLDARMIQRKIGSLSAKDCAHLKEIFNRHFSELIEMPLAVHEG